MSITEREYRLAQERGRAARAAGKPITTLPDYGRTETGRRLREAAETAWHDEDERRAKR